LRFLSVVALAQTLSFRAPAQDLPARLPSENLLLFRHAGGSTAAVKTVADWNQRRAEILQGMQRVMGTLPGQEKRCALEMTVESERDCGTYLRRLISYCSEPGSRVPAYLLLPKSVLQPDAARVPAILCLHPTDDVVGHGVVVGEGKSNYPAYGNELAERGFVVLAPSYPQLANYQPDLDALGWKSGTLKAVWDNMRGLDLLASLPYVAPGGFGAIGHSLGGHNAVFTSVFDDRITTVVSSCGLDSFRDYYDGADAVWQAGKGWTQTRYMPRLAEYRGRLVEIPFDFGELLGALAPRSVLVIAPLHDSNFRSTSVDRMIAAARPVFTLYDRSLSLKIEHPDCGHEFNKVMRDNAYAALEAGLR
jgi:hypothetical protein